MVLMVMWFWEYDVLPALWNMNIEISIILVCVCWCSNFVHTLCAAVNGNVECARILLQTSQNDDRNAVNCVDKLERFGTVWCLMYMYMCLRIHNAVHTHIHNRLSPFVRDYPGKLLPDKTSPTHTHEEKEEEFAQTVGSIVCELIPFMVL